MIANLRKIYLVTGILAGFFLLSRCAPDNRLQVDVSEKKKTLVWQRMDSLLFTNSSPSTAQIKSIRANSFGFFDIYIHRILHLPPGNDSLLLFGIRDFVNNTDIIEIHRDVTSKFNTVADQKALLEDGFAHYRHYFPNRKVPVITSFISGFNLTIASTDSVLGVGLDMYLGKDYKFYSQLGFPKYKTARMEPAYIPYDALKGWGQTEFEPKEELRDFLSNIIFNGKVLYFLDAMYPNGPDSLKIGYTQAQLDFCKKSEAQIWSSFISQKILFSSVYRDYAKYLNDGPTTNGFPRATPGMLGTWVGWQIVRKYMDENPSVTLPQLMQEMDANKILTKSKYKPV